MFISYALDYLKIARLSTAAPKHIELNSEDILGSIYGLFQRVVSFLLARSTADRLGTTTGAKKNQSYAGDHRTNHIIFQRRAALKNIQRESEGTA